MAITPISQYRGQDNSLAQILKGGQDTISSILNSAIQLGRDRVNNQMRQDENLNQMRAQETALAQRRGENLTSLIQDNRRISQNQRNADRQYARLDRLDQQSSEKDTFNRGLQSQEFQLRKENAARDATLDQLNIDYRQKQVDAFGQEDPLAARRQTLEERKIGLDERRVNALEQGGGASELTPTEQRIRAEKANAGQKDAIGKQFNALATNEDLVPNQQKKAMSKLQTYASEKNLKEADALAKLSPETRKLVANKNYDQVAIERNAIIRAKSFEDYFKGVDRSLNKQDPAVIDHYKELYRLGKAELGALSNTGANGAPGVLPNKDSVFGSPELDELYTY